MGSKVSVASVFPLDILLQPVALYSLVSLCKGTKQISSRSALTADQVNLLYFGPHVCSNTPVFCIPVEDNFDLINSFSCMFFLEWKRAPLPPAALDMR